MTDSSGQTRWTYDQHGHVLTKAQTTAGKTFTTAMSYDAAGRLATLTYPSGAAVTVSYDAAGRVSGLDLGRQGAGRAASAISPSARPTGWTQGNGGVYSRSFDTDGRIAGISFGGGTIALDYDEASRITGITETGLAGQNLRL